MLAFLSIAPRRCGSAFIGRLSSGCRGAVGAAPRALRPGLPRSTPGSLVTLLQAPLIIFNQSSPSREIIGDEGLPFCFGSPGRVAGAEVARRQRGRFPKG